MNHARPWRLKGIALVILVVGLVADLASKAWFAELLGMDPIFVANEGKLLAIIPADQAEAVVDVMRKNELGRETAVIGQVVAEHPGMVVAKTGIGGTRVISMQIGEQLPRIC